MVAPVVFTRWCPSTTCSSKTGNGFATDRCRHARSAASIAAFRAVDLVVADMQANGDFFVMLAGAQRRRRSAMSGRRSGFSDRLGGAAEISTSYSSGKPNASWARPPSSRQRDCCPTAPFRVVGTGQVTHLLDSRPPNVEHVPWVEYESIAMTRRPSRMCSRHLRLQRESRSGLSAQDVPGTRRRRAAGHFGHSRRPELLVDGRDLPPGRAQRGCTRGGDRLLA